MKTQKKHALQMLTLSAPLSSLPPKINEVTKKKKNKNKLY